MSVPVLDGYGGVAHEPGESGGQILETMLDAMYPTVPTTSNRRRIAWISNPDSSISAVRDTDASGAVFQFAGQIGFGGLRPLECWYLDNCPAGARTIYVASSFSHGIALIQDWSNVDLSHPCTLETSTAGTITATSSADGEIAVCGLSAYPFEPPTPTDVGTLTGSYASGTAYGLLTAAYKPGAASVVFTWSSAAEDNLGVISLRAAPVTNTQRRAMGRGLGRGLNRGFRAL